MMSAKGNHSSGFLRCIVSFQPPTDPPLRDQGHDRPEMVESRCVTKVVSGHGPSGWKNWRAPSRVCRVGVRSPVVQRCPCPGTVQRMARDAETGFQLGSAEGDGLGARQMVPDSTVISVRPDSVRPAKSEPTITSTVPSTRESVSRVGSMK